MRSSSFLPFFLIVVTLLIASVACGPSTTPTEPAQVDTPIPQPTSTSQPPEPEPTPTDRPESGAVNNLEDVQKAVVQIEAEGTFVDPEFGLEVNTGKRGSGFIIDPSGIAITNNHVVTGAAILRVWIEGEDKPRNAKILGVSECSDLAVIDIEGDGFAFLEWYTGDIKVGLDVYAAGFPLGDPEYTLTKGIISKASASGETNWASVDYVLEHTAKINPGNSGGPLVDSNGKLIGINYSVVTETDQNYSISREEAASTIEQMQQGKDVDSIGVNGVAVSGTVGDTPIYGVWVRSVESGSPADKSGLDPGDIIYQLENEVLGLDGTMADYCDVLRSRNPDDTMDLTIIRWEDLSLHVGQLNGRELELTGYFDDTTTASSGDDGTSAGTSELHPNCAPSDTDGYIECLDDTYTILVEVPEYWTDFNGGNWTLDEEGIGVAISAAPSLDDYNNYYDAPGVFFGASNTFAKWGGYVQFLDIYSQDYKGGCSYDGRYDYNDGLYRGKYDFYFNCGGAGGFDTYVLAAVPIGNETSSIIVLIIQVEKGDTETVERIWNTFLVFDL
jgi:serine protease Do